MNRCFPILIAAILIFVSIQGCTFNRANFNDLAQQQQAYYGELQKTLKAERDLLSRGLKLQVGASEKRRENLAAWALNLQKAEVLLQVEPDVTGNQRLLSYKLAEIDLAAAENAEYNHNKAARAAAILDLYDKLIKATTALEKNSKVFTDFLATSDDEFMLRNLDIDGIARAVAGIRDAQEKLGKIEKRSADERKTENENLQKSIERARDVLLKALEADHG